MKNINLFAWVLIMFTYCGVTDNNIVPKQDESNPFAGKWQTTKVSGGFSSPESFTDDEIVWDFFSNDSLKIIRQIDIPDNSKLPFKRDTVLSYSHDSMKITIGNNIDFEYKIDNKSLKLFDNLASDGIMIELNKK